MTYRCTGGFAIYVDGQPRVFAGGALVGDDDPILTTHKDHFEPVESYASRVAAAPTSLVAAVETATAGPGEARQTSTPPPAPSAPIKPRQTTSEKSDK